MLDRDTAPWRRRVAGPACLEDRLGEVLYRLAWVHARAGGQEGGDVHARGVRSSMPSVTNINRSSTSNGSACTR
jgi:hypothetical protein